MRTIAATLDMPDPVDGPTLRHSQGQCVFLTDERLCAAHAHGGMDAKPLACRQYPLVVVRTRDELRVGLDPGCLTTWQSWRTGPQLDPERALASRVDLPPDQRELEAWVLGACDRAQTVGQLLATLVDEPDQDGLPPGWATSWAWGARRVGLPGPDPLPPWTLGPEAQALAVETTRRMVHLRLASERGSPDQVARAVLAGAVLAAWRDPELAAFGTGLAQWTRAIRLPGLWGRVIEALP